MKVRAQFLMVASVFMLMSQPCLAEEDDFGDPILMQLKTAFGQLTQNGKSSLTESISAGPSISGIGGKDGLMAYLESDLNISRLNGKIVPKGTFDASMGATVFQKDGLNLYFAPTASALIQNARNPLNERSHGAVGLDYGVTYSIGNGEKWIRAGLRTFLPLLGYNYQTAIVEGRTNRFHLLGEAGLSKHLGTETLAEKSDVHFKHLKLEGYSRRLTGPYSAGPRVVVGAEISDRKGKDFRADPLNPATVDQRQYSISAGLAW